MLYTFISDQLFIPSCLLKKIKNVKKTEEENYINYFTSPFFNIRTFAKYKK